MMNRDDIQPLSEVRPHLTQHLKRVKETGRPLFITRDGHTEGVLLSPAKYDALVEKAHQNEIGAKIRKGMAESDAGKNVDARESMKALSKKHGLKLET